MSNVIEDIYMYNPIDDLAQTKSMDSDSSLKENQQENLSDDTSTPDNFGTSAQLEALKESLKGIPEVNAARVMYFKAEIELGNYQMDSDNIARKMLNEVEMA